MVRALRRVDFGFPKTDDTDLVEVEIVSSTDDVERQLGDSELVP